MKKRILIAFISLFLLQVSGNTQEKAKKERRSALATLFADNGISAIKVADNIDLVLIQGNKEDVSVKMPENTFRKLNLAVDGETLSISAKKKFANERIRVFITISNLRELVLYDDAFATTKGKLSMQNLEVKIHDSGRLQLGSTGRVVVDTPDNYQVLKESEYVLAHAITGT